MPIRLAPSAPTPAMAGATLARPLPNGREAIVHAKPGFDPCTFMNRMAQRSPRSAPRTPTDLARWCADTHGFDIVAAARAKGVLPEH